MIESMRCAGMGYQVPVPMIESMRCAGMGYQVPVVKVGS